MYSLILISWRDSTCILSNIFCTLDQPPPGQGLSAGFQQPSPGQAPGQPPPAPPGYSAVPPPPPGYGPPGAANAPPGAVQFQRKFLNSHHQLLKPEEAGFNNPFHWT